MTSKPVHVGQHHVEHDQVGPVPLAPGPLGAGRRGDHVEPGVPEGRREKLKDVSARLTRRAAALGWCPGFCIDVFMVIIFARFTGGNLNVSSGGRLSPSSVRPARPAAADTLHPT